MLNYSSFIANFNITEWFPFYHVIYYIVKTIPRFWKTNVRLIANQNDNVGRLIGFTASFRLNRYTYSYFIKCYVQHSTAISKWEQRYGSDYYWTNVINLPFVAVRDAILPYS